MATVNLGRIKFVWQGAYSGATAYVADDVVSYNGSSYICILASTNNLPTNTTYWSIMSSAGTNGTNGTDVGTTITTQGDILYRDASGLARLGAGTNGQVLTTAGAGANPSWTTVPQNFVSANYYEWTTRTNVPSTGSDQQLYELTTTLTKNNASSYFHYFVTIPCYAPSQGAQYYYMRFIKSGGSTYDFTKGSGYIYTGLNYASFNILNGRTSNLPTGTYTVRLFSASNGVANNGSFIHNPTSSDEARFPSGGIHTTFTLYEVL
jgi:hypothetical protein